MKIVHNREGLPRLIHVSSEADLARLQDSVLDVTVALDTPLIMVLEKRYFDNFDILFLFRCCLVIWLNGYGLKVLTNMMLWL